MPVISTNNYLGQLPEQAFSSDVHVGADAGGIGSEKEMSQRLCQRKPSSLHQYTPIPFPPSLKFTVYKPCFFDLILYLYYTINYVIVLHNKCKFEWLRHTHEAECRKSTEYSMAEHMNWNSVACSS